eukprot:c14327_g1_i1 orf=81-677(-)
MAPLLLSLLSISFLSFVKLTVATVYTVGGPAGWTTPSRANVNYTEWASSTPFKVGDTLEFNYVAKSHSVLEVTRTDFRYCNKTNPLATHEDASGKTAVELAKSGNYYFIDGVGKHCEEGQKFQAKVLSTPSGSISSSPSVGGFAPAVAPSSSSSSSSFEPTASPAIPPATAAASSAHTSITFLLSCLFLALFYCPNLS